jgi:hypothetical protein
LFEQKSAKSRWFFYIKRKNRGCLEIWCKPALGSSFPLRPSVKIVLGKAAARPAVAPYHVSSGAFAIFCLKQYTTVVPIK